MLPPGAIGAIRSGEDGRCADHEGRRIRIWDLPLTEAREEAMTSESTFLRVVAMDGGEGLVRVDGAGGLVDVDDENLLPVPMYLFPRGRAVFRGLFRADGRIVGLLDSRHLSATAR